MKGENRRFLPLAIPHRREGELPFSGNSWANLSCVKWMEPMTTLTSLPFILFVVVVVTAIAENKNVPYPLLLVIAGLIVGFVPNIPSWHPPSDIVLALFLPPILFSAARLISWQDVKQHITVITSLSVFLVLFWAIAIACVLCWVIPGIHFTTGLKIQARLLLPPT